jgi:hypothetical protein
MVISHMTRNGFRMFLYTNNNGYSERKKSTLKLFKYFISDILSFTYRFNLTKRLKKFTQELKYVEQKLSKSFVFNKREF